MATSYKPAQVQGTAGVTTYATLYEVPAAAEAIVSTIVVCNTANAPATYRIGLDDTAGTPGASEWLVYDATVPANDSIFLTIGASLNAGKFIRVSSSANTVTFTAFISEIS